ncbi:hypothetical protein BJF78_20950 [Pseudonocardia sp. CNS-139]|nr:hypothetical protein BJF78_20950 [Pseudonocardia sp. CNS-139]
MAIRWSVGVEAEGDRVLTHDEILELADAVAVNSGVASGIGATRYGARLIVLADDRDEAVAAGTATFRAAAARAGLPEWPIVHVEAVSELEDDEEDG